MSTTPEDGDWEAEFTAAVTKGERMAVAVDKKLRQMESNDAAAELMVMALRNQAKADEFTIASLRQQLTTAHAEGRAEGLRQFVSFLGEIATALGVDAQNDGWRAIEHARRLRAAAETLVRAERAHGAAMNDGTNEEQMRTATDAANAIAALEDVLALAARGGIDNNETKGTDR